MYAAKGRLDLLKRVKSDKEEVESPSKRVCPVYRLLKQILFTLFPFLSTAEPIPQWLCLEST